MVGGGGVWYRPSRYGGEEGLKERVKPSVGVYQFLTFI